MKSLIIIAALSSFAVSAECLKGYTQHEGFCAADFDPIKSPDVNYASDEKPRKEQQPLWQTGEIKADMPQSLIASDAKLDAEKMQADTEGKKNAGL